MPWELFHPATPSSDLCWNLAAGLMTVMVFLPIRKTHKRLWQYKRASLAMWSFFTFHTCFTYIAASSIVVLVAFCNPRDHSGVSQIPSSSHIWSKNNTRKTQHASVQLVRRHPDVGKMQHFSLNRHVNMLLLSCTCDSLLLIDLSSVTYAQHLAGACKRRQLCHVLADLKIAQQGGCSVYFGQNMVLILWFWLNLNCHIFRTLGWHRMSIMEACDIVTFLK